MSDLAARAAPLLELHRAPAVLALANVWDVVSARVVATTPGTRALATASHSVAATFGDEDGEDGERILLELHLDMVGRIARAVDLPVTMDMEAGTAMPAPRRGGRSRWASSGAIWRTSCGRSTGRWARSRPCWRPGATPGSTC